jgi:hypothetical protein
LWRVADNRFPLSAETPSKFEGVSALRGDGVIRMIQILQIYGVQIPEVERCTLQGEDGTDIQITD